jgi:uncharacterized protein (TIGR02646 family)
VIRITRPGRAPKRLAEGAALVAQMERDLAIQPEVVGSDTAPFKFKKSIYGHRLVKAALFRMQHSKCAYCEGRFAGNASGDVEHFRPKTFSQQSNDAPRLYPGYYWLAYTWPNLYYACEICNRSNKKNLFPIHDRGQRARAPAADTSLEQPMLVDPATEDPREHIGFRYNKPYAKTPRGEATIRVMGLDRASLDPDRIECLQLLKSLQKLVLIGETAENLTDEILQIVAEARMALPRMQAPTATFSAMAVDYLNQAQ